MVVVKMVVEKVVARTRIKSLVLTLFRARNPKNTLVLNSTRYPRRTRLCQIPTMTAAAPGIGEPPPRLPTLGYSLMTTADADIPFSPIGSDSLAFRNKNNHGTKNDVENQVTKTLF